MPASAPPGSCPAASSAALAEAGRVRGVVSKLPGRTSDRPELVVCLDCLRHGGTLVVASQAGCAILSPT
jgi:hypothetical protein